MSDLLHEDVYDSVLGLILFLLYIGDIKSVIQNAYIVTYYADDTIILKGVASYLSDPDETV